MKVFKNANGTNISLRLKKWAESWLSARQETPAYEGVNWKANLYKWEVAYGVEREIRFEELRMRKMRKAISAAIFSTPLRPRCNAIPSYRVLMLRDMRFWTSLHLLSEWAAWETCAEDNNYFLYARMIPHGGMNGQLRWRFFPEPRNPVFEYEDFPILVYNDKWWIRDSCFERTDNQRNYRYLVFPI